MWPPWLIILYKLILVNNNYFLIIYNFHSVLFCSLCVARTDLRGMASRVSCEVRLCVLVLYADDSGAWLDGLHLECNFVTA